MTILLHPKTQTILRHISAAPTHALLLYGAKGSGKTFTAEYLASQLLKTPARSHPYYQLFQPENGKSFGIEKIRELQRFLQLKTTGHDEIRRVVVVESAETMSEEAQNALLKSLEEPPVDTVIILLASDYTRLRPTILSRVTLVPVLPLSKSKALEHFASSDSGTVATAFNISGGLIGLMSTLLQDAEVEDMSRVIADAKEMLQSSAYGRLVRAESLNKDPEYAEQVLDALERLLAIVNAQAASKNQKNQLKRVQQSRQALRRTKQALATHSPVKLVMTDLCLNL